MLESVDTGKAVAHAKLLDLPSTVDVFRYMAAGVPSSRAKLCQFPLTGGNTTPTHGASPWAWSGHHALELSPGAGLLEDRLRLAAGCSVVIKPSEITPLSTLRLGELCLEAGLPEGVLNVVTGYGHEAGKALAEHPGVNKITFTDRPWWASKSCSRAWAISSGSRSSWAANPPASSSRCQPRPSRAGGRACRVLQFRADLLRCDSPADRTVGLRQGRRRGRRSGQGLAAGNGRDANTMLGPSSPRSSRTGAVLLRIGRGAGREAGHRGKPAETRATSSNQPYSRTQTRR